MHASYAASRSREAHVGSINAFSPAVDARRAQTTGVLTLSSLLRSGSAAAGATLSLSDVGSQLWTNA